jgi:pimeloyl-ACP methyl ester carboxylesterase
MNAELDPTLLAELRALHQSERAPAELERSVLERLLPSRGKAPLGAKLRAWWNRAPLGWTVLGATLVMAAVGALYLRAPTLSGEPTGALGPEPRLESAGEARRAAHCPLDDLPPGFAREATRMEPRAAAKGLQVDTFAMTIPGCPPLVRRALSYVPQALSVPSRAPVLLVLHDGGESAEGLRELREQRSFEFLAERAGLILVYANAAPAAGRWPYSGSWQTDPSGADRSIDDFAYLARIVERLGERGLVEWGSDGPDVYLVGYGSGARLALEAAARHPERYAGVAALLPDKINAFRPPPRSAETRLSRMFFVTLQDERPWAYWPGVPLDVATIDEWAVAIGLPRLAFQQGLQPEPGREQSTTPLASAASQASLTLRHVVPAGTRLLDIGEPDQGGPAVRVLVVQSKDAIEVSHDGSPALLDVATLTGEFLLGPAGKY